MLREGAVRRIERQAARQAAAAGEGEGEGEGEAAGAGARPLKPAWTSSLGRRRAQLAAA